MIAKGKSGNKQLSNMAIILFCFFFIIMIRANKGAIKITFKVVLNDINYIYPVNRYPINDLFSQILHSC